MTTVARFTAFKASEVTTSGPWAFVHLANRVPTVDQLGDWAPPASVLIVGFCSVTGTRSWPGFVVRSPIFMALHRPQAISRSPHISSPRDHYSMSAGDAQPQRSH